MPPKPISKFKSKSKTSSSPGNMDFAARRKLAMEEEKKRKEEEAEQHATLKREFGVAGSDADEVEKQNTPGSSRRSSFHTDDSGGSPKKRVSFSDPLSEDGEVRAIVAQAAEKVLTRPSFVRQTPSDTNTDAPVELHVAFEEPSRENQQQKKTRSFTTSADNNRLSISEQEDIVFEDAKRRSLDGNVSIDSAVLIPERKNETLTQAKEIFLPPPTTTVESSNNIINDRASPTTSAFAEGATVIETEVENVEKSTEKDGENGDDTAPIDVHFSGKSGSISDTSTHTTLLGTDSQKSDNNDVPSMDSQKSDNNVSTSPAIRAQSMMRPVDVNSSDDDSDDDSDGESSIPSTTDLATDSKEYEMLFPNANKYNNNFTDENPMLSIDDNSAKNHGGDLRKSMSANISLYKEDSGEDGSDLSDNEYEDRGDDDGATKHMSSINIDDDDDDDDGGGGGGGGGGDDDDDEYKNDQDANAHDSNDAEETDDGREEDKEVKRTSSVLSLFGGGAEDKDFPRNNMTNTTTASTTRTATANASEPRGNAEDSTGLNYLPLNRMSASTTSINYNGHPNTNKSIASSVGFLAAPQGHLGNIENEIETMNYALRAQIQSLSRNITQSTKLLVQENQQLSATKFDQVLETLDRRIKVAFDTYDEVARETESKVDGISTTVTNIDKAMTNKRREEEYSHQQFLDRVVKVFEEKLEDKMAVINQSTDILHDQFEELKRFHGRTRENDRKEIQNLIEDSHAKHGVRIKEHHDVLLDNHGAFDEEVKSFRKESDERFNNMEQQMSKMFDSVESFNTNAMQQVTTSQQELAEKFEAFTKKIEDERREDQKQILQLVKESHKIATGLVEKSQENLLFSQSEVADLKKKLFAQEQQNYDLRREYGKLVAKMENGAVSPSSRSVMQSTNGTNVVNDHADSNGESKSSSVSFKTTPTHTTSSSSKGNTSHSQSAVNQLFLVDPDDDRSARSMPSNISPYKPDSSGSGIKNMTLPLGHSQLNTQHPNSHNKKVKNSSPPQTSPYLKKERADSMLGVQKHNSMRF